MRYIFLQKDQINKTYERVHQHQYQRYFEERDSLSEADAAARERSPKRQLKTSKCYHIAVELEAAQDRAGVQRDDDSAKNGL